MAVSKDRNECQNFKHNGLYIRLIEKEDLEDIRFHRNDYETWINLTDIKLIYEEQQLQWYQKMMNDRTKMYFIVFANVLVDDYPVVAKESIGLIRIDEIDLINKSARVGCDIFKPYRNKGFGQEVMRLVVDYCFDYINLHRLWLLVADYNESAIAIYSKVGFTEEGRQKDAIYRKGKYHDYVMMSLIRKVND